MTNLKISLTFAAMVVFISAYPQSLSALAPSSLILSQVPSTSQIVSLRAAPMIRQTTIPPANYNFNYAVRDLHTGDIKEHQESSHGGVVTDRYSLADPDGTTRTVKYTADEVNGFSAVVYKSGASSHPIVKRQAQFSTALAQTTAQMIAASSIQRSTPSFTTLSVPQQLQNTLFSAPQQLQGISISTPQQPQPAFVSAAQQPRVISFSQEPQQILVSIPQQQQPQQVLVSIPQQNQPGVQQPQPFVTIPQQPQPQATIAAVPQQPRPAAVAIPRQSQLQVVAVQQQPQIAQQAPASSTSFYSVNFGQ